MDWGTIATIVGCVIAIVGFFFTWMNGNITRLDSDVNKALLRIDETNKRIDANMSAINQRVDSTQAIIMRMLEKQGR